MLKNSSIILYLFFIISVFVNVGFADNPVVQTCFTADPAPLVHDNAVYVYVGHDSANAPNDSYLMRAWKCYSSKDMVNWTDHGVALPTSVFSWSGGDADAAQAIYRNGIFYYYISTTASGGVALGVAVSNNPIGPFKDTLGKPLITASQMTGCNATHSWRGLDPTVFIDDDGQAYLYWGNNVCYWVKLNNDMISYTGSISCIAQTDAAVFGPDFEEAPWVYKRNSLYYLIYASEFPECIRYATSSNPTGPWTYKSQIMAKQPGGASNTIHPGACDFGGNSYFFYHNAGLTNGGSYRRSVCVEQFTYNTDGTIPAIPETKGGVMTGVGNLNPYDTVQAETICWESGVKTEVCSEGGIDVTSIHNGDNIKVEGVDFGSGAKSFDARIASENGSGNIELHLDQPNGETVGICNVGKTGGNQSWKTQSCDIIGAEGIHDLYFDFTGGSGELFNFNWWKFKKAPVGIQKNNINVINSIEVAVKNKNKLQLTIDLPSIASHKEVDVTLYNLNGRMIRKLFSGYISSNLHLLTLNQFKIRPGMYLLSMSAGGKRLLNKKLLFD
ncbi:MAG: family 43 glycosylhydrolase [Chitinispirillaceae bacterium]|nr:family 43 glycosylhydrolase [Chitinispirillaceae bacterium]